MSIRLFLLAIGFTAAFGAQACPWASEPPPAATEALKLTASSLKVEEREGRRTVTTLGEISNSSGYCFEDLVVEVKYFDAQGVLRDSVTQSLYGLVVPAGDGAALRVMEVASQSADAYVRQELRLLNAEPRARERPVAKESPWIGLAISWGPLLLLVGVWLLLVRRYQGKNSPNERLVVLMAEQNRIQSRIADALAERRD